MRYEKPLLAIQKILGLSLTELNPQYIADTLLHEDINAYAIKALSDAEFAMLTMNNDDSTDLSSESMMAGDIWYFPIKDLKLTSGSVLIYLKQ